MAKVAMVEKKETVTERADRFESTLVEIWQTLENADGSRAAQQEAMDSAQELIEAEVPDVAVQAADDDDDADDGDADDDEEEDE
jgi:hypothetical protein